MTKKTKEYDKGGMVVNLTFQCFSNDSLTLSASLIESFFISNIIKSTIGFFVVQITGLFLMLYIYIYLLPNDNRKNSPIFFNNDLYIYIFTVKHICYMKLPEAAFLAFLMSSFSFCAAVR